MTGYNRGAFGKPWVDTDHNKCDTRNDVLRRDLKYVVPKIGCVVQTGRLTDPYTGLTINFVRGPRSIIVEIDHVVALGDSWAKGSQYWTPEKRLAFANDPLELLAVSGSANSSKGDGDAATWLPPQRTYWCKYVARQTAIKAKYGIWMTQAEHDRIYKILSNCPNERIPTS